MNMTQNLNLTDNQKVFLITELQSKIKEIINKKTETVEQFDEDGECYDDDFYVGSVVDLELDLNCIIVETILN